MEPTEKHTFNHNLRVDRGINEMLGIARLAICDGKITDEEAVFLRQWIQSNSDLHQIWPVFVIAERLQRIFADGVIDETERQELLDILQKTVGGGFQKATQLPISYPLPDLIFENKTYVFTGKFAFGTRRRCEEFVISLGGRCTGGISKDVDYLVVGEIGSADWKYSTWGTKIREAVERKSEGYGLDIIPEKHWAMSIRRSEKE